MAARLSLKLTGVVALVTLALGSGCGEEGAATEETGGPGASAEQRSDAPPKTIEGAEKAAGGEGAAPDETGGPGAPAWQRLNAPPEETKEANLLEAGEQLLLYGGCTHDYASSGGCGRSRAGLSFDTESGRWQAVPSSPTGISGPSVWTGDEAIIVNSSAQAPLRGVAFDPIERSWRELPEGPVAVGNAAAVWSGEEMIVWGGLGRNGSGGVDGAAYDPSTDTWRVIARAPNSLNQFDLVWTGTEVIAFGAQLDRRNGSTTRQAAGAAYDPEDDEWREIAPSKLIPNATTASWLGDRMIAYDYVGNWQTYDPAADEWTDPERMPLDTGECYPDSIASGGAVVGFYCGQITLFDPRDDRWYRIDGGLTERLHDSIPVWRFSQLARAGNVIYLLAEGITFGRRGEARYGFSGAPESFWALRPAEIGEEDTNANSLEYCGPPKKANQIRVEGFRCDQARSWIFGVPGKSPVRIPPLSPGSEHRFRGLICHYKMLEANPSGGLEVSCVDESRERSLTFVVF